MDELWRVALNFASAVPALIVGGLGYFFGRKSKQDRVINDLVILEKLETYKERQSVPNVDRDIEDSRARLENSLGSLRGRSPDEKRDLFFVLGASAMFVGAFVIGVVLPSSAQSSLDDHPVESWFAISCLFGGAASIIWWVVLFTYDVVTGIRKRPARTRSK